MNLRYFLTRHTSVDCHTTICWYFIFAIRMISVALNEVLCADDWVDLKFSFIKIPYQWQNWFQCQDRYEENTHLQSERQGRYCLLVHSISYPKGLTHKLFVIRHDKHVKIPITSQVYTFNKIKCKTKCHISNNCSCK